MYFFSHTSGFNAALHTIPYFLRFALMSCLLCVISLCLSCIMHVSYAMADEPYDYTITLSAGDGTFSDGSSEKTFSQKSGTLNLDEYIATVKPASDRYYVKGIALAGHDELASPLITSVTADQRYVIVWGVAKDQVSYRVSYVDVNGQQLLPDTILYGNTGDKPVAAYRYIEGYLPQASSITKTLSTNESQNVLTFVYEPIASTTTNLNASGESISSTQQNAPEATQIQAAANEELLNEDGLPLAQPAEIIDLDDNENPLASLEQSNNSDSTPIALGVVGVLALIALCVYLRRKRKALRQ